MFILSSLNICQFVTNNISYIETYLVTWNQASLFISLFQRHGLASEVDVRNILYVSDVVGELHGSFGDANPKAPKALIIFLQNKAKQCTGKTRPSLEFIKYFTLAMSLITDRRQKIDGTFGHYNDYNDNSE